VSKLAISLDYYTIQIDKAVSSLSTTDILDGCYKLNPSYTFNESCAAIGRNPANGTFNGADSKGVFTLSNSGYQKPAVWTSTSTTAAAKQLNLDPKFGTFDLSFAFNQVQKFDFKGTPTGYARLRRLLLGGLRLDQQLDRSSVQAQVQPAHHLERG
jgi:hypothetical protein